ncbi:MAG: SDR family NAD(P)-dependent oxidoreductase, partial [Bacteroidota bacterium]|nr:SDR family NAD(P)-dependent oxidoreductase [Bacteroidota bacterium]
MTKTALITGAAKRVGKGLALHLAAQGWSVAIHYNTSADDAIILQDELKLSFPNQQFELFNADLNLTLEVENLVPKV